MTAPRPNLALHRRLAGWPVEFGCDDRLGSSLNVIPSPPTTAAVSRDLDSPALSEAEWAQPKASAHEPARRDPSTALADARSAQDDGVGRAGGRFARNGAAAAGLSVRLHRAALVAVLVAAGALAGCDTTIETPDSLFGTYTLWGALDPTADVQSVRVVAVTDTLLPTRPDPLPVTLASVDLATGKETPWRDSLVTFRNGSVGHVYRARFRPAYEGRYRVVLRRDADGKETSASLTVPPRVVPVVQPVNLTIGVRVPVLWPGAPQLNRVRITYLVQARSCNTEEITVALTESSGTSEAVAGGWAVVLNLSRVAPILQGLTSFSGAGGLPPEIGLRRVTVRGEIAGPEWRPPGGVFDFEAFASPEVFDNVDGGFGFVGGAYRSEISFRPNQQDLTRTTFVNTAAACDSPGTPAPRPTR